VSADAEVLELYSCCKGLALAAGASLLLDRDDLSLSDEAIALADRANAASTASEGQRGQIAGIREAALAIAALVQGGPERRVEALEHARETQREVRSRLGSLLAPQYAPCGAITHNEGMCDA
jgi:hypothetical protein